MNKPNLEGIMKKKPQPSRDHEKRVRSHRSSYGFLGPLGSAKTPNKGSAVFAVRAPKLRLRALYLYKP